MILLPMILLPRIGRPMRLAACGLAALMMTSIEAAAAPPASAVAATPPSKPAAAPAATAAAKAGGAKALGELGSSREPISIDADRLDVFDKEGRAVFTGNVIAIQGETTMKCTAMNVLYESSRGARGAAASGTTAPAGTASGGTAAPAGPAAPAPERAPATPGTGLANDSAIRKIECKGPVVITTKTQTATGDRAEFDRVVNKVFLIGNAALSDGPNVTRGERVAYDLNTGVANVEGGRVRALIVPSSQKDKDKDKPKPR